MFERRHRQGEKGAALIEAAIVLPLWLLLFYGSVEAYFLIDTYTQLSQVVREGVNTGALGRPDAPNVPLPFSQKEHSYGPGEPGDAKYVSCLNNLNSDTDCGAIIIAQRIRLAIKSLKPRVQGGADSATIVVRRFGSRDHRVEVSLSAPYRPLFPISTFLKYFGARGKNPSVHTMTVQATGPYGVMNNP